MLKHHFLFLTNVNNTYSALLEYSNQFPDEIDFVLHSTKKESEHFGDLRNIKVIKKHLSDNSTIIFYLTGYLSLYVINEYYRIFASARHKIVFVFSSTNLLYPGNNINYKITRQLINTIESKSANHLFLSVFITEDIYRNHLINWDKKYFPNENKFISLIIPTENLIEEIIKLFEKKNRGKIFYLVNSEYKSTEKLLAQIKISILEKILSYTFFRKEQIVTKSNEASALLQFVRKVSTLNQENVIELDVHSSERSIQKSFELEIHNK